jgi:hemoglobin-like flavoprotein
MKRGHHMTPAQKSLVQNTFEKVAPQAEDVAALFYNRLFELDPSLKPLFTNDIHEQGLKLMQMLAVAVRGLDRLEEIVPAVQGAGAAACQLWRSGGALRYGWCSAAVDTRARLTRRIHYRG